MSGSPKPWRQRCKVALLITPTAITTDSRLVQAGDLFIPVKGERNDGHQFIDQAVKQGAALIACDKAHANDHRSLPNLLLVDDTIRSLGLLAHAWIKQFALPTIAITGSNGKTTTKDMLASILSQSHNPHLTRGNWNNHIGLPFTCLQLRSNHTHFVAEMGMSHFDEIAWLTEVAQPTVGLITNVMPVHLEGVGNLDGVVQAKGELWQTMAKKAVAIVNADYPQLVKLASSLSHPTVTFSAESSQADVYLKSKKTSQRGLATGVIVYGDQDLAIELTLPGEHNLINAVAAAAAAKALNISANDVSNGLQTFKTHAMRSEVERLANDITLYIDCYNANPGSMAAAINAASNMPASRHLAAFGDMGELADNASQGHLDTLKLAKQKAFAAIYCYGPLFEQAAKSMGDPSIHCFKERSELSKAMIAQIKPGDLILIKGSRATQMERIFEKIERSFSKECA